MQFFKSVLAYSINLFGFLSRKVDVKALELQKRNEEEINIPYLINEYQNKANAQLNNQFKQFEDLGKDIILLQRQLGEDKERLNLAAEEIIKAENETNTVDLSKMTEIEKINHEFSMMNMRSEAANLFADIQFNEKFLGEQIQSQTILCRQYHENRQKSKSVLRDLQTLQQRNAMLENRVNIEQIEIGVDNYKLNDIKRIVNGKEAAFESNQIASAMLQAPGAKTELDRRIETAQSNQINNDFNDFLLTFKESKTIDVQ